MTTTQDTRLSAIADIKPAHLDWIRIHPEVLDVAPHWTTRMSLYFEEDGSVGVGYNGAWGAVQLGTSAIWEAGKVTPADNGLVVLYFDAEDTNPAESDLRDHARDFLAAADALAKAGA